MRAWVVGNGPSLNQTPLDKLIGEVSFGVNRIHLLYDKTAWRPTYYVRAEEADGLDVTVWKEDLLAHLDLPGTQVYCNQFFTKNLERELNDASVRQRVHRMKTCWHYRTHFDDIDCPHMWHLPALCDFGSSVNVAVQLAVTLGYSPIYLVGCDLGYKDEKPSHFDPEYVNIGKEHLRGAHYANMDTLAAHMIARRSSPVPILNATLGGNLEVYDRVEFSRIIG